MPNADYQRHSFLGGEVSPSLYERSDMEKFGKWFSKAENIRFRETGAFRNRYGFVKVANTKSNSAGETIKLLSFSFNDEESFLIELGPRYARFYKDGRQITIEGVPYELETPFESFSKEDLKYAQSGDTIFIAHPQYGLYQLARLNVDGTVWEIKKFESNIFPMKEQNDDKNKTISTTTYTANGQQLSLAKNGTSNYLDIVFTYNSSELFVANNLTKQQLVERIKEELSNKNFSIYEENDILYIQKTSNSIEDVASCGISFADRTYTAVSKTYEGSFQTGGSSSVTASDLNTDFSQISEASFSILYKYASIGGIVQDYAIRDVSFYPPSYEQGAILNACIYLRDNVNLAATVTTSHATNFSVTGNVTTAGGLSLTFNSLVDNTGVGLQPIMKLAGTKITNNTYSHTSTSYSGTVPSTYTMTFSDSSILSDLAEGECVLVKNSKDTQQLAEAYDSAGSHSLGPITFDGNWSFYNLGNWDGTIDAKYSTDNGNTWVSFYKLESNDTLSPANDNTSGSIVSDDLMLAKVDIRVDSTGERRLQAVFTAKKFTVNSYYKIISKLSSTEAVVQCLKNDVGEIASNFQWRLPAFSAKEGWPQTIAFYQDRLFLGKDYIVYGSKTNDFWDFYEPISVKADDPITMSLLSTKVNNIKNLVTQRSFFTFTGGGEFGVGSQGALTQSDKYLKPFSSNGSAQCAPVLISDVVLFVDKSYNSVRALKYSLESDGYEAPDITLTLRSLLENERIISTDIIYEEKEALFLSDSGIIWVLKYITDQQVLSWSHWKHDFGKITNICVVPNGAKHDLYIAVESNGYKWIEKMSSEEYMDTVEYFAATSDSKVSVTGGYGDKKVILQGNKRYFETVDANGQINTPDDEDSPFKVGSVYTSTATLLSPTLLLSEYSHSTYELKNPFKVFFYYLNSYGFKVGIEENEKMEIEWQNANADIDDENNLTSGKKSVLIPSSFDGSSRVSFVQQEPYPMEIVDVLIQTDFGGK